MTDTSKNLALAISAALTLSMAATAVPQSLVGGLWPEARVELAVVVATALLHWFCISEVR